MKLAMPGASLDATTNGNLGMAPQVRSTVAAVHRPRWRPAAAIAVGMLSLAGVVACSNEPEASPADLSTQDTLDEGPGGDAGNARPPVTEAPPLPKTSGPNLVVNFSFEDDNDTVPVPKGWTNGGAKTSKESGSFVGRYGGGHDGAFHLTHWSRKNSFEVSTKQTVKDLAPASYIAWVWVKTGGPVSDATFSVTGTGGSDMSVSMNRPSGWHFILLGPFDVASGSATLVLRTKGGPNAWVYPDNVHLHRAG